MAAVMVFCGHGFFSSVSVYSSVVFCFSLCLFGLERHRCPLEPFPVLVRSKGFIQLGYFSLEGYFLIVVFLVCVFASVSFLVERCKEEYRKRSAYFAYLVKVKHDLLAYQMFLKTLTKHIER